MMISIRRTGALVLLAVAFFVAPAFAGGPLPDTDSDGVDDFNDNCVLVINPTQIDTDADGFGNFCDADYDNNGVVTITDLAAMKLGFFTTDPNLDLNGDNIVNFADLGLLKIGFFLPPGPGAIQAAPSALSLDNNSVPENQPTGTAVGNFSTFDLNASDTHTYSLVAGTGDTDNAQLAIVGNQLQTAAVLNHETTSNCLTSASTCSIRVQTDDGNGGMFQQSFIVNIDDLNDAPIITSDGGNASATVNVAENQSVATTVTAADEDSPAQTLTFSITGGADAALFGIGGASGVLTFNAAPDFENATDVGGNNVYDVQVTVTDNGAPNLTDVQAIAVSVTGVNDAPTDIALDNNTVDENQPIGTAVGNLSSTDVDSAVFTYSLVAGTGDTDNAQLTIVANQLQTAAFLDHETAISCLTSASTCSIRVQTDDGAGGVYQEVFTITINDLNDAPIITSDGGGATASVNAAENQTAATTVTATDADAPAQTLTFSITGGADAALFSIGGASGVLTFNAAPDFENATDAGGNNVYDVQVTVTDNGAPNLTDVQAIAVTVTDVALENVPPVITSDGGGATAAVNAAENQAAVTTVTATDADAPAQTLTFSITGGADAALLSIGGASGVLTFNAAPDFENATDAGGNNVYDVQVTVTDDGVPNLSDVQAIAVNVTDVNDPPVGVADSYTGAIGNTDFTLVTALPGTTPVPPTVTLVGSVGSNDQDQDGDTVGAVAGTVGTSQGGSVTIDANGRFVYSPPAGLTGGNDTFAYTPFDGTDAAATTTTVTIAVANIVWYVDDSSPNNPGTGTSADPFRDLSSAAGPSLPGEPIFIFSGTQTTGITLQNNQSLLGEGLALVINTTTLVDAGARPVIANAAGAAVTLGSGNTVRGLNITGSQRGIVGNAFGTLTADNVAISTSGGAGIDLNSGAGSVTLDSLSSSSSSGSGIDLDGVSGSFSLGGGSISGSSGDAVLITNSNADLSYSGTITAGSGLAVNVSGHSANSVSLGGLISSTGQGILLNNNGGGTINLSGGMSLSTGAFTAFSATNGGTVNVTGTNSVTTTTATAVAITATTIGSSGVTFQSINSTGSGANAGIILDNSGSGTFTVAGTGGACNPTTPTCTGGTISNKTDTAVTFNNTGGRITLNDMQIKDIGSTAGGFNTRSGHDGIHGQNVNGGLTLDNVTIQRISDNCVNGSSFADGITATFWSGLDILNSTIENCNRFHVAGVADNQDEGGVRIAGLTGSVTIDNNVFSLTGEHLDIFTHSSGTLNMGVTGNFFVNAFKEFNSGPVVATGGFCVDVTVEGSSDANVTIGGSGNSNDFENCAIGSIRVTKDTVPAGSSNIDAIVANNTFRVTDQTSANGVFGNTPQGGVTLRAGPGSITTFDGLVEFNTFGITIGPDDRIGSTAQEVANADGVGGNLSLIFDSGASQARVNNNTFNGSINAPWANRADGNASAKVLYVNNSYRGRDDYCCDSGFTFTVPGIPYITDVRNGGALDITLRNDNFIWHDQFFFAQTETIEMNVRSTGGTLNVCLDNVTSGDGFEFDEDAGTINLYQGAVNNAATGPCVVEANGHPVSACELEVADDGVRGGPNGHNQASGPNPALNPPHIDIDSGVITITSTPCQEPSGGIF